VLACASGALPAVSFSQYCGEKRFFGIYLNVVASVIKHNKVLKIMHGWYNAGSWRLYGFIVCQDGWKTQFTCVNQCHNYDFAVWDNFLKCIAWGTFILKIASYIKTLLLLVSGEKISLSISLLLGYTIFAYLLAVMMPSTANSIPVLASYILFTMILLMFSILCWWELS